jgi:DNA-binding SARP family transcriptional activator/pimeloyl-ACP methyl ester carboxylesterase
LRAIAVAASILVVSDAVDSGVLPVRLFGSLAVRAGGTWLGPRDFGGVKPKQLLEMLLLDRGRMVTKDELADRLWGEQLPERVAATVETYVSLARRHLGDRGRLIVTEPRGYRFAAEAVSVDLDDFDRLAQAAASVAGVERRGGLEAALAVASGEVLIDEPYADWAQPVRAQYRERRIEALLELAECCLALGVFADAARHAEDALAVDATLERGCRAAILGHYALGDQSEALAAYARCRAALASELGVVPLPETLALHSAVLRQEPVEALLPSVVRPAPPVSFASHGRVRLAYQTVGEGTTDLVFVPPFATHLGGTWDDPTYAGFLRGLASFARLTVFDKRGTGLSDPVIDWPSVEDRADDIAAVGEAIRVERAVLLGVCDGGVLCALCAARHPERLAGLVIAAGFPRLLRTDDYPFGWSPRFHDAFLNSFEDAWTDGTGMQYMNPSVAHQPRYRNWYARHVRLGVSPGMARRLAELNLDVDIRGVLPQIEAPTLVLTRAQDPWVRAENSRYLAEHIPDAELVELPGVDHEPWIGDSEPVFAAVERLVARVVPPVSLAPR